MKNLFYSIPLIVSILIPNMLSAQTKHKLHETDILGYLVDSRTEEPVYDAKVTVILASDTNVVIPAGISGGEQNGFARSWVSFTVNQPGNYIVKCEKEGYETTYNSWSIEKLYKSEKSITLRIPFFIKKQKTDNDHQLGEVVVKATKVKFYVKGDTMVYNADAFELAEGSMLDALIKQLPGVELKEGGDILVNGRHVDELLLNGKDFFNEDRKLILDNLPSYTVKNIKIFEKKDMMRALVGDTLHKNLAMDVRLKKEYSVGLIGNAEAGMGTDHRFLARLFGMRFAPHSNLTFYANTNNLSDDRTPGEQGNWSPLQQATGVTTLYSGGLKYNYSQDYFRYMGDLKVSHSDGKSNRYTNSENFLSSGNTFGRNFANSKNHNTTLSAMNVVHDMNKIPIGKILEINSYRLVPQLRYRNYSNNSQDGSATANSDIYGNYGKEWRDSITAPNAGQLLRSHGLNRVANSNMGKGHRLSTETEAMLSFNVPHHDNIGMYFIDVLSFTDAKDKLYDHYNLQYLQENTTDFRNRYNFSTERGFSNRFIANTRRITLMPRQHLDMEVRYTNIHQRETRERSLYLLNKLDAWGEQTTHNLGELPSVDEMLQAIDNGNSYWQRNESTLHEITAYLRAYNYRKGDRHKQKHTVEMKYQPTVSFYTNRLHYQRGVLDTVLTRYNRLFEHSINVNIWPTGDNFPRAWTAGVQYNLNTRIHDLSYLVDYRDDSNPLNIMLGNPNIKNAHTHNMQVYFTRNMKKQRLFHSSVSANIYEHRLAMGYIYDTQTGVRTVTPDNVNGNWDLTGRINYSARLDKNGKFTYSTNTDATYTNSVDLIEQLRSEVHATNINETLKLNARFSAKASLNVKADLHYMRATSNREDFSTINVADFDYGLGGVFQIPLGFQFSTDMTMYSRRGYNDHSMNTNELVWNARLSRHFAKAGLTVMLDAFDLFGQLSNVRRTINAQGRTETWSNVTPQYAMLHILYRLNKKPKK